MQNGLTPGDLVGQRVRRYRLQRGWTVRQLAEECAKRGAPSLTHPSITNLERGPDSKSQRGRRAITVDELLVLAYVLDVPPALLVIPLGEVDEMQVAPGVTAHPTAVLRWFTGISWLDIDRVFGAHQTPIVPGVDQAAYDRAATPIETYHELTEAIRWVQWMHQRTTGVAETVQQLRQTYEHAQARRAMLSKALAKNPTDETLKQQHLVAVVDLEGSLAALQQWQEGLMAAHDNYKRALHDFARLLRRVNTSGIQLPLIPAKIAADLPDTDLSLQTVPDEHDLGDEISAMRSRRQWGE